MQLIPHFLISIWSFNSHHVGHCPLHYALYITSGTSSCFWSLREFRIHFFWLLSSLLCVYQHFRLRFACVSFNNLCSDKEVFFISDNGNTMAVSEYIEKVPYHFSSPFLAWAKSFTKIWAWLRFFYIVICIEPFPFDLWAQQRKREDNMSASKCCHRGNIMFRICNFWDLHIAKDRNKSVLRLTCLIHYRLVISDITCLQ